MLRCTKPGCGNEQFVIFQRIIEQLILCGDGPTSYTIVSQPRPRLDMGVEWHTLLCSKCGDEVGEEDAHAAYLQAHNFPEDDDYSPHQYEWDTDDEEAMTKADVDAETCPWSLSNDSSQEEINL